MTTDERRNVTNVLVTVLTRNTVEDTIADGIEVRHTYKKEVISTKIFRLFKERLLMLPKSGIWIHAWCAM